MLKALKTAGPRYTPEIHVDLPIAAELDAFGRTELFFDRIKAHARGIRDKLRSFEYSAAKSAEPTLDFLVSPLSSKVQRVLTEFGAVTVQPIGGLPFERIADQVAAAEAATNELERVLLEREQEYDQDISQATAQKRVKALLASAFAFTGLLHQCASSIAGKKHKTRRYVANYFCGFVPVCGNLLLENDAQH